MRIGISCHSTAGGSGILATELGIALAKRGHTIHFVTTEPLFRLRGFYENIFCHTVNLVPYPLFRHLPFTLALSTKMFEVAKEHDIELWHVHYAIPYAACAVIAREMMPKDQRFHIVTTLHGTDITLVGIDPSYFHLTKFAMERSCTVTAVSNWLANETQQAFELSKPIHTIYNFVNLDRFSVPVAHRENLAKPDEKIVMHISNFRPVKRVTDVVRTFKKILERVNARLIMVGDGPERISATGVARQLGITDKIAYLGNNETVESILPLADLVFQPSEHESFGLVPSKPCCRACPSSAPPPAASVKSSNTASRATCARWATPTPWPAAPSTSCSMRKRPAPWAPGAAHAPTSYLPKRKSSTSMNSSTATA